MLFWIMLGLANAIPLDGLDWYVVNDTVMGGVSSSQVLMDDSAMFSGVLSLERNGGFASARANVAPGMFDGAHSLRIHVNGDGRTYDVTLWREDISLRAGSYRVSVRTEVGRTEIQVPLADFRPTSFGRPVYGAPSLDSGLSKINTIGILLADKQPGPFELEILEVSLLRDADAKIGPRQPTLDVLAQAIKQGVPRFNEGDPAACREIYANALLSATQKPGLTPGERSIALEALTAARGQAPEQAAWTLRNAMDTVLYTVGPPS
ncbi:MAG: hypothetical protein GWP91_19155 [Rhodobacterales bacterium]|nr:hypothetical protein [Rhodobacterales bacterium]